MELVFGFTLNIVLPVKENARSSPVSNKSSVALRFFQGKTLHSKLVFAKEAFVFLLYDSF